KTRAELLMVFPFHPPPHRELEVLTAPLTTLSFSPPLHSTPPRPRRSLPPPPPPARPTPRPPLPRPHLPLPARAAPLSAQGLDRVLTGHERSPPGTTRPTPLAAPSRPRGSLPGPASAVPRRCSGPCGAGNAGRTCSRPAVRTARSARHRSAAVLPDAGRPGWA